MKNLNRNNPVMAEIRPATKEYPKFVVMVKEFKHNTLRGDSYWVVRDVREYRLRSDAENYASRFNDMTK